MIISETVVSSNRKPVAYHQLQSALQDHAVPAVTGTAVVPYLGAQLQAVRDGLELIWELGLRAFCPLRTNVVAVPSVRVDTVKATPTVFRKYWKSNLLPISFCRLLLVALRCVFLLPESGLLGHLLTGKRGFSVSSTRRRNVSCPVDHYWAFLQSGDTILAVQSSIVLRARLDPIWMHFTLLIMMEIWIIATMRPFSKAQMNKLWAYVYKGQIMGIYRYVDQINFEVISIRVCDAFIGHGSDRVHYAMCPSRLRISW